MMLGYRGHAAEATGANIIFPKDGYTPYSGFSLNGITRQTAIELL